MVFLKISFTVLIMYLPRKLRLTDHSTCYIKVVIRILVDYGSYVRFRPQNSIRLGVENFKKLLIAQLASVNKLVPTENVTNHVFSLRLRWSGRCSIIKFTTVYLPVNNLSGTNGNTKMRMFQAFVHFSTAFCHVDLDTLNEEVHKSAFDAHNIMRLPSWLDENSIKMVTPQ